MPQHPRSPKAGAGSFDKHKEGWLFSGLATADLGYVGKLLSEKGKLISADRRARDVDSPRLSKAQKS